MDASVLGILEMKRLITNTVSKYPDAKQVVERHRPSIFSGLNVADMQAAIIDLAAIYPEVLAALESANANLNSRKKFSYASATRRARVICDSVIHPDLQQQWYQSVDVRVVWP